MILKKIDDIKKDIKLKNIYDISFYDKITLIDFKNLFYEKVFDVDAGVDNFLELNFKMLLELQDTSDRHYIRVIYEIFDENNNRLYIKKLYRK